MGAAIQPRSEPIDGTTGDAVCHLFPNAAAARSFCGVPRDEQSYHGQVKVRADRCDHCGLPRCRACRSKILPL